MSADISNLHADKIPRRSIALLVVVFLVLFAGGLFHLLNVQLADARFKAQAKLLPLLEKANPFLDQSAFWNAQLEALTEQISRATDPSLPAAEFQSVVQKRFGIRIPLIIWDSTDVPRHVSPEISASMSDLILLWHGFMSAHSDFRAFPEGSKEMAEFEAMRRVFGKHLFPSQLRWFYVQGRWVVTERSLTASHWWVRFIPRGGEGKGVLIGAKFPAAVFQQLHGITEYLDRTKGEVAGESWLGIVPDESSSSPARWASTTGLPPPGEWKDAHREFLRSYSSLLEMPRAFWSLRFVGRDQILIVGMAKPWYLQRPLATVGIGVLLLLLFSFPVFGRVLGLLDGRQKRFVPIRLKLAVLFLFVSSVPLALLGLAASDFLVQRRLERLAHQQKAGLTFLQRFDQRYRTLHEQYRIHLNRLAGDMVPLLAKEGMGENVLAKLVGLREEIPYRDFYLIASSSDRYLTQQGGADFDRSAIDERVSPLRQRGDASVLLGQHVLMTLNGRSSDDRVGLKIELLAETLMQRSLPEILHAFLETSGEIRSWGLGKEAEPTFIKIIECLLGESADYLLIINFESLHTQWDYLQKDMTNAQRSSPGFTLLALQHSKGNLRWPATTTVPLVENFIRRLDDVPSILPQTVQWQGEEYLVVGQRGQALTHFNLVGLVPVRMIAHDMAVWRLRIFFLGSLTLLFSYLLATIVGHRFVAPIDALSQGAQAIAERKFEHRVPVLGANEFGNAARVFNEVVEGLKDLQVARIVQESLFPQAPLDSGVFRVFGRSRAMTQLGGDYFDYFPVDETHVAVIIGDVAGHGVPAALMMAMAKAGVMHERALWRRPAELMQRLHQMFLSVQSAHRRRMMTCQIVILDSASGGAILVHAGHCFPLYLRDKGRNHEFFQLSGSPLGGMKRAVFREHPWTFQPDETLVLYTDGWIETPAKDQKPLGYGRFAALAGESWGENPQDQFVRVSQAFGSATYQEGAQDDLTMVIVTMRRPAEDILQS